MPAACHPQLDSRPQATPGRGRWLLVGAPNSGKSALFGRLTGLYATVSNYPGTSVEVTRGSVTVGGRTVEVVDAPGLYSLLPVTEEERVARRALLEEQDQSVILVMDVGHLARSLPLALQLLSLGRPLVIACNLLDEARARGAVPDLALLSERLGVPVVGTVATTGEGVEELRNAALAAEPPTDGWVVPAPFSAIVADLASGMTKVAGGAAALVAELGLAGDDDCARLAAEVAGEPWAASRGRRDAEWGGAEGFALALAVSRSRMALALLDGVLPPADGRRRGAQERMDRVLLSPWTGFPIVALVLYFGFYRFVGSFGAGTVVDWIETVAFDRWLTPAATALVGRLLPWPPVADLLVGPYGLFTLGVRYAVAIVLPIVAAFFLVFALLEDSGYLPRLALLLDRALKKIGLSGRAVIPLILGFGCGTMATLVTRTLETKRERVIATLLLALAIPCSAQLGVVMGILSATPALVGVWGLTLLAVFLGVGKLAALFMPGEAASFYLELPPLRRPLLRNVLLKTGTRMRWYFVEIFPLFLLASALLWAGSLTGLFDVAVRALEPLVGAAGLPVGAAPAFLYGFFRRDFGAAGLYDLARQGALSPAALTSAAVTITLFVPCVAQFLMMKKERGLRVAVTVLLVATAVAFATGGLVGRLLRTAGVWS